MGFFPLIDLLSYDVFFRDTSCVVLLDLKLLSTIDDILLDHCIDIKTALMYIKYVPALYGSPFTGKKSIQWILSIHEPLKLAGEPSGKSQLPKKQLDSQLPDREISTLMGKSGNRLYGEDLRVRMYMYGEEKRKGKRSRNG